MKTLAALGTLLLVAAAACLGAQPASTTELGVACGANIPAKKGFFERLFDFQIEMAVPTNRRWSKNRLTVRFTDAEAARADRVKNIAEEWTEGGAVTFDWVQTGPADIRVSLPSTEGAARSEIGRAATLVSQSEPTMVIGFSPQTSETQLRAWVLHEFGHALGAIHEHQRSDAAIQWDKLYVTKFYESHYRWGEDDVRRNVFEPQNMTNMSATPFDRTSVMMYPILKNFTTNNFVQDWNSTLSAFDKQLINELYAKP